MGVPQSREGVLAGGIDVGNAGTGGPEVADRLDPIAADQNVGRLGHRAARTD